MPEPFDREKLLSDANIAILATVDNGYSLLMGERSKGSKIQMFVGDRLPVWITRKKNSPERYSKRFGQLEQRTLQKTQWFL